ncbi:zinc knuckle CX2CX4HX4C containing protein [Tanacetum coccineum]
MELVLEQTQQGTSYEVSVSAEGVEELKRKVKIKGEKKEALLTLRQKPDSWNEEPCRDVHQVGDKREVEVPRNFNWPSSELITEDGVLPEEGAIYRTEVCTEVCAGVIYPNTTNSTGGPTSNIHSGSPLGKTSTLHEPNIDSTIVHSVDINMKPTSYAGAAGASTNNKMKVNSNFCPLVADSVFNGRLAFPIVEYYARNNWVKHGLKRIKMNAKGFFFFKFDTRAGLEALFEGGPWMICNSPIIMKKWFLRKTLPLIVDNSSEADGFQEVARKKTNKVGSSHNTNYRVGYGGNGGFQTGKKFEYIPKGAASTSNASSVKRNGSNSGKKINSDTLVTSNPFEALSTDFEGDNNNSNLGTAQVNEESDEDVENVFDESVNLLNTKMGASTPDMWKWTSNGSLCSKGSRIILGWNDDLVEVMIMSQTNQVMHVQVNTRLMRNRPWVLLGDFNAALNLEDHSSSGYEPSVAMRDFKECVLAMEVTDVNCTGLHFTWNQKSKGSNGILKKINRIIGNLKFNDEFLGSFAIFQPYRISDHSPCVHRIPKERVNRISVELNEAQKAIERDPYSSTLREEHAYYLLAFKESQLDEERFLKQKAKVEWLKAGDSNTAYFYRIVNFTTPLDEYDLYARELDSAKVVSMVRDVKDDVIKSVIFSMGDDKAPGPNGFTAAFFKKAWDVVGGDVTCAIRDFFSPMCISKIIANRVKEGLGDIVSINQSAFVPGRRISDNILLAQELMRNYHRQRGPPRCAFKVDIQKAYTVDWKFLETVLVGFGFHPKMVQWIVVCVSGASYSICVNGNLNGWFKGKRGLRQGDHLSPYLFTLDIEVLTLILQRRVCYLSVRYLGVPLISSRLLYRDCKVLVEKLESRVNDWRNKFLSLAGRLQLIRFVLSSMHIYLDSVFFLPCRIIHDLEQLMRGFLWCQGEMKKGKAKVSWDSLCVSKHEGGLGICKIKDFNDVPCRGDVSWGWRKLLQIHSTIRPFIWHKINNGKSTSVCFDTWANVCRLKDMLSNRDIMRSGFTLHDSFSNLISDGVWRWPPDWLSRFPAMAQIQVPMLIDDTYDVILWRNRDGVLRCFSVACVWDTIRSRADVVHWYNVVWFRHCIPRHAIHMWLVIRNKLKTQDRLRQWDVGPSTDLNLLRCPLCDLVPDSHSYLFFECSFSLQVWSQVRVLCSMDSIPPRIMDVLVFIIPISKGRTVVSILSRIVVADTSYYLWQERNGRLFKKKTSSPYQIVQIILSMVRLKLVTFKFKKMSSRSRSLLDQ